MGGKSSKGEDIGDEKQNANQGSNPFIAENRKCTDILCCILFIVFWVGMLIIAGVGYKSGQPEKLVFGVDWMGRTCGAQASATGTVPAYDFRNHRYLLYPRLAEDLYEIQVQSIKTGKTITPSMKKFFGVCVSACPVTHDSQNRTLYAHAFYDYTGKHPVNIDSSATNASGEYTAAGSPWRIALKTSNVFYRCLDLGQVTKTSFVRCVDPCSNGTTMDCGDDINTNPFRSCGTKGCTSWVKKNLMKCKVAETKESVIKKGSAKSSPLYDNLNTKWAVITRWLGDIEKAAIPILLSGGLFALLIGIVWVLMLKVCTGLFVWLTVLLVIVVLVLSTLYLAYKGEVIDPSTVTSVLGKAGVNADISNDINVYINNAGFKSGNNKVQYWAISAYIFIGLDVIVLFLLCFMCSRIKIAIGIIREASKALTAMPLLVVFPIIPTFAILALVVYWVITAAFVATSGQISISAVAATVTTATNKFANSTISLAGYSENNVMNYMLVYHLFGLLWTNQFLQAFGYMTMAGAVCEYYWTLDKRQIRIAPIMRSFGRTFRYHLGSLAFGSLIIAMIQMARIILEYIDQKTKNAQEGNYVVKVALMCCKCCLWCFEQCMKFLNKNAFIMIAMKGTNFCTAMKDSFTLLLSNAGRVATVSVISTFLLLLGKLFIVAFSCCCMFMFIYKPPKNMPSFFMGDIEKIDSPIFPGIVTAILAYSVATFFLGVYGTAIDTILLCFCEDCNVNKSTGTYYMSDELLAYVDGPAKKNAFRRFKEKTDGHYESRA